MDSDHHVTVNSETGSVGSQLRRLRESKAIALNDAAEATRISRNYLQALEEDRPDQLPSPAYLKGFTKTYAVWLGLKGEELALLLARTTAPAPVDAAPATTGSGGSGSFNWQRLFLPSVLLAALIISAIFLAPPSAQRVRKSPLPAAAVFKPVSAVQPIVSSVIQPVTIPLTSPAADTEQPSETAVPPSPVPQDGVLVRMKVVRNSTLTIVIDDGIAQGYELTSGDLIEWKAAHTIAMDISEADSVELQLNNTPLQLQAPSGKPVYIVLDANGIRH